MEQSRNKDNWIEEVLSSTDGIKRAEAGPYIFPKILHRLKTNNIGRNIIPMRKAAIGFVTIMLLAVLNVFVVLGVSKTGNVTNEKNMESSSEFIPSQCNPYLETLTR